MKAALLKHTLMIVLILALALPAGAQALLQKTVTLNFSNRPLVEVLKAIEKQGGFYFSYSNKVVQDKRMVSVSVKQQAVKNVLDQLLGGNYAYKETQNHIIIQQSNEKWYTLSGYVLDASTGLAITDASVYERHQLVAALTNHEGYFRLRLRDKYPTAAITISKEWYTDTSIIFTAGTDQVYRLPVSPIRNIQMNDVVVTQNNRVPDSWLARMLLSANLKAQARNISGYLASRPVQASFTPGLGTHGKLSGEVVNKFSLNILGGYTAGSNGVEIGGIFNIDKQDVDGVQVAGVFNIVGGKTNGVQVAGVYNGVLDSVRGVQVSGVMNNISGSADGIVVAGVYNGVRDEVTGTQISGVANITRNDVNGTQISGVVNYAEKEVNGFQFSGVFNYAKTLHGVQVGLINIADSSDGCALGLFNFSKRGYHKISLFANDITHLNLSYKTGNAKLYTIFIGGLNIDTSKKAYTFGIGLGHDFVLDKKKRWTVSAEATMQHIYLGSWDHSHFIYRFAPSIHYRLNKLFSIYAGPALAMFESPGITPVEGYKTSVIPGETLFKAGTNLQGWISWQAGITIF